MGSQRRNKICSFRRLGTDQCTLSAASPLMGLQGVGVEVAEDTHSHIQIQKH